MYLDGNYHGLFYSCGEIDYDEIYSILRKELQDVDTVYVKGHGKKNFLEKTLSHIKFKLPKLLTWSFLVNLYPN